MSKKNKWPISSNATNCNSATIFQIANGDEASEFDPIDCRSLGGPAKSFDCGGGSEIDVALFKTPLLDDIVTGSMSYPSGHQGEAYDNRWYAYGLFREFPELLEDYEDAEDFYDAVDTTILADLYFVYYGLQNLYVDFESESNELFEILDHIEFQDSLLIKTLDSLDIETVSAKNDSLINAADSLYELIVILNVPIDTLRDSIESYVMNKISPLNTYLSSITPVDSIQIKLKQVLGIMIARATNDTLTTLELSTLEYIANQCYYTFGPAVLIARNYYPVEEDYDEENCPESRILSDNNIFSDNNSLIYPNPSKNQLIIKLPKILKSNIKICDLQGKCNFSKKVDVNEKTLIIDIVDWPSGNYYITYLSDKFYTNKFIIIK